MGNIRISVIVAIAVSVAVFMNSSMAADPDKNSKESSDVRTIISEDEATRTIVVGVNKAKPLPSSQPQTVIISPDYNCYAPYKRPQPHRHEHHLPPQK